MAWIAPTVCMSILIVTPPPNWLSYLIQSLLPLSISDIDSLLGSPISILLIFTQILSICLVPGGWSPIYSVYLAFWPGFPSLRGGPPYCSPQPPVLLPGPGFWEYFIYFSICWGLSVWERRALGAPKMEENFEQDFEGNVGFFSWIWNENIDTVAWHSLECFQRDCKQFGIRI